MILKNSLYNITSFDPESRSFRICLVPGCFIYRAHFPEQPVTPGVCIIQIATELLAGMLQCSLELETVANAKFLAVIDPVQTDSVVYSFSKITHDAENGTVRASVAVEGYETETVYSKLSLVYRKS